MGAARASFSYCHLHSYHKARRSLSIPELHRASDTERLDPSSLDLSSEGGAEKTASNQSKDIAPARAI